MSNHFILIKDLEFRINESDKTFGNNDSNNFQVSKKMMKTGMIIHCADFNGGVRSFPVSHKWSKLLNLEFIKQYTEEGELGYP